MREPIDLEGPIAMRGKLLGNAGKGPRTRRPGRVCTERVCRTVLSIYNPGDRCWDHTEPTPFLLKIRRARTDSLPA
jgi:hypothetical protein